MTDSERLKTVPEGIRLVSEVSGELASRAGGRTSVLAATTYLPMDVDSVARVFEGLEEIEGIKKIQEDHLTLYEIAPGNQFAPADGPDIDTTHFLSDASDFLRAVGRLKHDEDWTRKVKEQHRLIHIAAHGKSQRLELEYLVTRVKLPRARIQSILNDFHAQGYIGMEIDADADLIFYHFPDLDYPPERFVRNLALLEEVVPERRFRVSLWISISAFAIILLAIVILLRF